MSGDDAARETIIDRINMRGIAGIASSETEEEKARVERSQLGKFQETLRYVRGLELSFLRQEHPPLPDFSCKLGVDNLFIELTEFIDPKLVMRAKHIRADHKEPLHKEPLWFDTNREWFESLLKQTILKKEEKYQKRKHQIDILLIYNEAVQVGIEDTNNWIGDFKMPSTRAIKSVYFQSWYHPGYERYPTWSLDELPQIGKIRPQSKRG